MVLRLLLGTALFRGVRLGLRVRLRLWPGFGTVLLRGMVLLHGMLLLRWMVLLDRMLLSHGVLLHPGMGLFHRMLLHGLLT